MRSGPRPPGPCVTITRLPEDWTTFATFRFCSLDDRGRTRTATVKFWLVWSSAMAVVLFKRRGALRRRFYRPPKKPVRSVHAVKRDALSCPVAVLHRTAVQVTARIVVPRHRAPIQRPRFYNCGRRRPPTRVANGSSRPLARGLETC